MSSTTTFAVFPSPTHPHAPPAASRGFLARRKGGGGRVWVRGPAQGAKKEGVGCASSSPLATSPCHGVSRPRRRRISSSSPVRRGHDRRTVLAPASGRRHTRAPPGVLHARGSTGDARALPRQLHSGRLHALPAIPAFSPPFLDFACPPRRLSCAPHRTPPSTPRCAPTPVLQFLPAPTSPHGHPPRPHAPSHPRKSKSAPRRPNPPPTPFPHET